MTAITAISRICSVKDLVEAKQKSEREGLLKKLKLALPNHLGLKEKEKENLNKLKQLQVKLHTVDGDTSDIQNAIDGLNDAVLPVKQKIQEAEGRLEVILKKIIDEFHWVESTLIERYVKVKFLNNLKIFYKVTIPALVYFQEKLIENETIKSIEENQFNEDFYLPQMKMIDSK